MLDVPVFFTKVLNFHVDHKSIGRIREGFNINSMFEYFPQIILIWFFFQKLTKNLIKTKISFTINWEIIMYKINFNMYL